MKKEQKETIYECRHFDNRLPAKDRMVKTGQQTLGAAQMFAIKKSEEFGFCAVAEILQYNVGTVAQEDTVRKWGYLAGQEVDINTDYQAAMQKAVADAHKKLKKLETQPKENTMSDVTSAEVTKATKGKAITKVGAIVAKGAKSSTKVFAKPSTKASLEAKAKGKGAKVAGKGKKALKSPAKASKPKKPPATLLGTAGTLLGMLGARQGSLKGNLWQWLVDNKGKLLPLKDAVKATYGNANEENFGPMQMSINGVRETMVKNKIAWHIERDKDDKGSTIGLKAGAAK